MKIKKAVRITKIEAKFGRGFISGNKGEGFHTLHINASIGRENEPYDYGNWNISDLKDLAEALTAFLKEI